MVVVEFLLHLSQRGVLFQCRQRHYSLLSTLFLEKQGYLEDQ
jgi:hypothetical protein